MDDTLRPKHHINPPAQCDSPKDAAAVSPPPQAQGMRQANCEEEDTLVMKHEKSQTGWCSSRKWSEERRKGRGRGDPLERKEQERNIRESREVGEQEREDKLATGPLEDE